jgi:hypothetical protein
LKILAAECITRADGHPHARAGRKNVFTMSKSPAQRARRNPERIDGYRRTTFQIRTAGKARKTGAKMQMQVERFQTLASQKRETFVNPTGAPVCTPFVAASKPSWCGP